MKITTTTLLDEVKETLADRGKTYDAAKGQERSMPAIVAAFNAIYASQGIELTEHMGWQFMALVKMVRNREGTHRDSAVDQIAYAALAAETLCNNITGNAAQEVRTVSCPELKLSMPAGIDPNPTFAIDRGLVDSIATKEAALQAQGVLAPTTYAMQESQLKTIAASMRSTVILMNDHLCHDITFRNTVREYKNQVSFMASELELRARQLIDRNLSKDKTPT